MCLLVRIHASWVMHSYTLLHTYFQGCWIDFRPPLFFFCPPSLFSSVCTHTCFFKGIGWVLCVWECIGHDTLMYFEASLCECIFVYLCVHRIPSHGREKAPVRTYIQQLCADTGCIPEDLPGAMDDREGWWEKVLRYPCWWRDVIMICVYFNVDLNLFLCLMAYQPSEVI